MQDQINKLNLTEIAQTYLSTLTDEQRAKLKADFAENGSVYSDAFIGLGFDDFIGELQGVLEIEIYTLLEGVA